METRLKAFLVDCKVSKDDIFTHTIKQCDAGDWSPGRYYISEDYLDEFWTLYCNCASSNAPLSILEKPGPYTPLRVDFDFKAPLEVGIKRQYSVHTLKKIIKIYQNEIKEIIPSDSFEERYLWCIVLEKPKPRIEDGKIKDGFHLHFPHFICGSWVQDYYLRERVVNKMLEKKVWKHCIFNTKIENVIDERMAGKTWMLYGSMNYKGHESSPYIYKRWNTNGKKWGHAFDHKLRDVQLDDFFEDEMYGRKSSLRYYLPRFLSVRGWLSETPLTSSVKKRSSVATLRKKRQPNVVHKRSPEKVKEDLRYIKDHDIMDMLSDNRSDDYGDWFGVGRTLFDIGEACDEAFNMWVDFSKRSVKFVEGTCEEYWGRMDLGHRTLGSLLYLAKIDNPKDYKEFQLTSINNNLYQCAKCLKPNEYAVAQVVIQMFQNRFKCVDAKRDIWYEYRGHKWVEDDGSLSLKKLLANEVYDTFVSYERDLLEEKSSNKGDTEATVLQKKIWAYQEKLRTGTFEKQVVEMCKLDWYDKDFYKNINENRSLIGCENGVLDLEVGVFRSGRPDDYITFSTGLNFNKEYTYDHPDIKDLDKYLSEVFPNKNRREYFLDFLCATLQGNDHKRFLVATGDGDNSKSMMMGLLEETFGLGDTGYYGKFPPELVILSKGHSSGQCRPELSRVRGKKIMGIDEITNQQQLNIMEIKRLTGNDSYYARAPFEKGTEIRPQFTLILQCLCEGTFVSLSSGISVPIENMTLPSKVLSWNEYDKGIVSAEQTAFLNQGIKECVTLTLLDGTEITCTPDHRFLDSQGQWVEAQNIILGETNLTRGVYCPRYDDLVQSKYTFGTKYSHELASQEDITKGMALCRLIGYGITDGTQNNILYLGHKIDAERVVDDIELLAAKRPKIVTNKHVLQVHIPRELTRVISDICHPQLGGRLRNPKYLPEFIFDKNCPLYLVREFIAGMFGGDGVIPGLNNNAVTPLHLVASKTKEYLPSLIEKFESLSNLMSSRLGIKSYVQEPLEYEPDKYKVTLTISGHESHKKFIEQINARYCCHKSYRLTAILGYFNYKMSIMKQNQEIILRTKDLLEKYERQHPVYKIRQSIDGKTVEIHKGTKVAQKETGIHRNTIFSACKSGKEAKGYNWEFYYEKEPTKENEKGCRTIQKALEKAIKEQPVIFNKSVLVTYSQVGRYIRKNRKYEGAQINYIMREFMENTGLKKFCNNGKQPTYSVGRERDTLPVYNIPVIGRTSIGTKQVYDISVKTHSNFLANDTVSHNCNDPPKVPGNDTQTWNRIRVLDFESKFVIPSMLKKYPVPSSKKEQIKKKRFHADPLFKKRLPELAPALLWKIFDRFKDFKDKGLMEPKEVLIATDMYKSSNDIFMQFINERIEKIDNEEEAKNNFIRLQEVYSEFQEWYRQNYPSYNGGKDKVGCSTLKAELIKRLGVRQDEEVDVYGFGKLSRWYGYKIAEKDDDGFGRMSSKK
jgi:phage/plasmid-associated DNA primase